MLHCTKIEELPKIIRTVDTSENPETRIHVTSESEYGFTKITIWRNPVEMFFFPDEDCQQQPPS